MTTSAFEDQIASQPDAVQAVLASDVPALDSRRPIVLTGIGTSLHACRVAAGWAALLSQGRVRPVAVEAHDLALLGTLTAADQVVVVSHRGTKRFPNAVLHQARAGGAFTIAVTGRGAPEPEADVVLRTCPDERASTHTVSYVTALAALGLLLAGSPGIDDEGRLRDLLGRVPEGQRRTLESASPDRLARRLVDRKPLVVTGSGLDAVTADEAALKLMEGTYCWAHGMSVEFALHGTPAVFSTAMAALCIRPGHDDGGRTDELGRLLDRVGALLCTVGDRTSDDLWFAPVDRLVRPLVAVVSFQRLVASLARLLGASPDLTHTEAEPWRSAILDVKL